MDSVPFTPPEPRSPRWRRGWRRRAAKLAAAAALLTAAFLLDDRALAALSGPWRSGQANAALFACRFFGEGLFVAVLALGWLRLQPRRWPAIASVAAAALLAGGLATAAKPLTARRRPDETLPALASDSWSDPRAGGRNSSFPSGHTATAFAMARGVGLGAPPLRGLALACALGTGASRVRDLRHYPSDCVAAALGGWWLAGACWRLRRRTAALRRLRAVQRAAPPRLRIAG